MDKAINRPKHPCQNPACGNTLFVADCKFDYAQDETITTRIWRCTNCTWTQPRITRYRPNNDHRAHMAWRKLRDQWQAVNVALDQLVANGAPSGCILVHSSTFNNYMDKLLLADKPTNRDIAYNVQQAKRDLERAQEFVKAKQAAQQEAI